MRYKKCVICGQKRPVRDSRICYTLNIIFYIDDFVRQKDLFECLVEGVDTFMEYFSVQLGKHSDF